MGRVRRHRLNGFGGVASESGRERGTPVGVVGVVVAFQREFGIGVMCETRRHVFEHRLAALVDLDKKGMPMPLWARASAKRDSASVVSCRDDR